MTRRKPAKQVDRSQAGTYLEKGRRFRADAENAMALGDEFSGNGIAVLCVHAAIAYTDSLTVRARGIKSASGDHTNAVTVLESAVAIDTDADRAAVKALRYILQRKDEVSYTANLVDDDDARQLLRKLAAFADWVEQRYARML